MRPFVIFPKPKNLETLESKLKIQRAHHSPRELRAKVSIAVVDDEQFQPLSNLTNHGFQLKHFPDVSDLSVLESYQIILCDLQGVGTFLNPNDQGAHLIRELKTNYAEKYVLSYTGGASNTNLTRLGNQYADSYVKKDADIATWQEKLDAAIFEVTDPVVVWKKFRARLIEKYDLNLLDVIQFENAYVQSCLENSSSPLDQRMRLLLKQESLTSGSRAIEEFVNSPALRIAVQLANLYLETSSG